MSRLITMEELDRFSETELHAIFNAASATLAALERGSPEFNDAKATLENVRRVLAARKTKPVPAPSP